jgi:hypothetical protein
MYKTNKTQIFPQNSFSRNLQMCRVLCAGCRCIIRIEERPLRKRYWNQKEQKGCGGCHFLLPYSWCSTCWIEMISEEGYDSDEEEEEAFEIGGKSVL